MKKQYTTKDFLKWNRNPAKPTIKRPPHRGRYDREHWIADLAKEHKWTLGAELGIWRGRTFLHVLKHCPKLTLIGVDLWAPQPNNPGPETWENWPHAEYEKNVRKTAKQFGDRHESDFLFCDYFYSSLDQSSRRYCRVLESWSKR